MTSSLRMLARASLLTLPLLTACRVQPVTKGPCNAPTSTPTGGEAHAVAVAGADHLVRGVVRDAATGRPVGKAIVELTRGSRRQVADSAGRFVFHDVPFGTFTILARRYDYAAQSAYLTLASGNGLDVEFALAFLGCERSTAAGRLEQAGVPRSGTLPSQR